MKVLFCNTKYPGFFEPLVLYFAARKKFDVRFLSLFANRNFSNPAVSRILVRKGRERNPHTDPDFHKWEQSLHTGIKSYNVMTKVKESGWEPDIIFVSNAGGLSFFLRKLFPKAFFIGYAERTGYWSEQRAADWDMQLKLLTESDVYFLATEEQRNGLPKYLANIPHIYPLCVDTNFFVPKSVDYKKFFPNANPAPKEVIFFDFKVLDSQKSEDVLYVWSRLLVERPQCAIIFLPRNNPVVKEKIDCRVETLPENLRNRIFSKDILTMDEYRDLLCASNLCVCPCEMEIPFKTMLEAFSCGTPVAARGKVCDSIQDTIIFSELPADKDEQFAMVNDLLDKSEEAKAAVKKLRPAFCKKYGCISVLTRHLQTIQTAYQSMLDSKKI